MNYELAKKLKDAGFPQWNHQKKGDVFCKGTKKECYIPILEELIEAIGDGYLRLERSQLGWQAFKGLDREISSGLPVDTLEEAVAHLWLKLNKDKLNYSGAKR